MLGLGLGLVSACVGGNDEEENPITCRIQPETESCVCSREEGGDRESCTPADVEGACFGNGDYCVCRPWRCVGTEAPCSCEFVGVHPSKACTGTSCCFQPDQNGGYCDCLGDFATCTGTVVADCNFATIAPFLAKTDGTFPRVEHCP